jgi:hypothetical protein
MAETWVPHAIFSNWVPVCCYRRGNPNRVAELPTVAEEQAKLCKRLRIDRGKKGRKALDRALDVRAAHLTLTEKLWRRACDAFERPGQMKLVGVAQPVGQLLNG